MEPQNKVISRPEARRQRLKKYYTGVPCSNGHIKERRTVNGECTECTSIKRRISRLKGNKEITEECIDVLVSLDESGPSTISLLYYELGIKTQDSKPYIAALRILKRYKYIKECDGVFVSSAWQQGHPIAY